MTYQGWANYPTWNIALWINNDESIHHALEHYANETLEPTYKGFIARMGLIGERTGDGIGWLSEDLDYEELDQMVANHKEVEGERLPSDYLPRDLAQKVYETKDLIKMLKALEKDGYSGLGLGLIVDLIERDVPECN
jgi:hypothetical protein